MRLKSYHLDIIIFERYLNGFKTPFKRHLNFDIFFVIYKEYIQNIRIISQVLDYRRKIVTFFYLRLICYKIINNNRGIINILRPLT